MSNLCACVNTDYHSYSKNTWDDVTEVSLACISTNSYLNEAPWVRDGVLNCAFVGSGPAYSPFYDYRYDEYDIQRAAASYYLLDVVIYDLAVEFDQARRNRHNADPFVTRGLYDEGARPRTKDQLLELSIEAQLHKHEIVMEMAPILRLYMHRAVVGEMCHHELIRQSFFPKTKYALVGWQELIKRVGAVKAVSYAVELFDDKSRQEGPVWNSAFGGRRWADIARVLQWYEQGFVADPEKGRTDLEWWQAGWRRPEFSEYEFIDRVLTLQHNTGTALDKVSWSDGLSRMHMILDAHHESDIPRLNRYADESTVSLVSRYWKLKNEQCGMDIPFPKSYDCRECGSIALPGKKWCKVCIRDICVVPDCEKIVWDYGLCTPHLTFLEDNPNKFYDWESGPVLPRLDHGAYCVDTHCECTQPKYIEHWHEDKNGYAYNTYEYQVLNVDKLKEAK